MNETFRRPQSDIKARVTVSVWTGSQVGFVSFAHRFGLQSTFGTSRTDMQVISFVKSFQFRFLVVDRSTRMLLYNKDQKLPSCRRFLLPLFSACNKGNRRRLHVGKLENGF